MQNIPLSRNQTGFVPRPSSDLAPLTESASRAHFSVSLSRSACSLYPTHPFPTHGSSPAAAAAAAAGTALEDPSSPLRRRRSSSSELCRPSPPPPCCLLLPPPLWPEAMAGHGPSMTVAALAVRIPVGRICHGIDEQKLIAGRRAGGPSERRRRAAAGGGDGATSSSGHGARLGSSSSSLAGAPHLRPPSLLSPSATAPLLPGKLRYSLGRRRRTLGDGGGTPGSAARWQQQLPAAVAEVGG